LRMTALHNMPDIKTYNKMRRA